MGDGTLLRCNVRYDVSGINLNPCIGRLDRHGWLARFSWGVLPHRHSHLRAGRAGAAGTEEIVMLLRVVGRARRAMPQTDFPHQKCACVRRNLIYLTYLTLPGRSGANIEAAEAKTLWLLRRAQHALGHVLQVNLFRANPQRHTIHLHHRW